MQRTSYRSGKYKSEHSSDERVGEIMQKKIGNLLPINTTDSIAVKWFELLLTLKHFCNSIFNTMPIGVALALVHFRQNGHLKSICLFVNPS